MERPPAAQLEAMKLYMSRLAQGPGAAHTTSEDLGVEWLSSVEHQVAVRNGRPLAAGDLIIGASELLALAVYAAEQHGLDADQLTATMGSLLAQVDTE